MTVRLDPLRLAVQTAAKGIEKTLKPGGDWMPFAFIASEGTVTMVQIPPHLLNSDDGKDLLCDVVLPKLIRENQAEAYALLLSAWGLSSSDPLDLEEIGPISEHPDRTEQLLLTIANQTRSEFWQAKITRPKGRGPRLGAWTEMEIDMVEGRFFDAPMQALRGLEEK